MMAGKVNWYGPAIFKAMERKAARNLSAACIFLTGDIRNDLERTPFPPASTAGQVPHWRSRQLAKSMTWEVRGLVGRVGHDHTVKHGLHTELGTRYMAPRPHLRPALDRNRQKLLRMMSKP